MEKCLLLGNGAREAVLAEKISEGFELCSIMPYENPTISEYVKKSNGKFIIGNPFDKKLVEEFIKQEKIENCLISSDNLLKDGLIDLAKNLGLKTFGPTSKASKIEWSKTYALDIVKEIAPEMIIKNFKVTDKDELKKVIEENYKDDSFVVKPEGLTGGKGVKVGGIHFNGKDEGYEYALSCLEESGIVIIQDKVAGREFTVTGLTDGKNLVITPTTFDYPYRFDEDKGPGTGGMGCLAFETGLLPFLTEEDIEKCADLMKKTINYVNKDSIEFTGPIYGGFFKCENGIKFIEFNARFGDPEAMNILNTLETPFKDVFNHIQSQDLTPENCKFAKKAICTVYMVSPNYAISASKEPCKYTLNTKSIKEKNAKVYFASSKRIEGNNYESVGNSRLVAILSEGRDIEEAKHKVYNAIEGNVDDVLNYRKDIGTIYVH
jgi:phosphoribosylamine--glycine ligase